jgi:hypothetical protein
MNPIPRTDKYFFIIHSNIILPSTARIVLKVLYHVGLPVNILKVLLSSILAVCPAHLNLLDLMTLNTLYERHKI